MVDTRGQRWRTAFHRRGNPRRPLRSRDTADVIRPTGTSASDRRRSARARSAPDSQGRQPRRSVGGAPAPHHARRRRRAPRGRPRGAGLGRLKGVLRPKQ